MVTAPPVLSPVVRQSNLYQVNHRNTQPICSKGSLMPAYDLHHLRMVIQQIGGFEVAYRIAVYGDGEKPRHADFNSGPALLEALCAVLPDFNTTGLSLDPLHKGQGSIVFAGEVELSDRQLGLLGLIN